MADYALLFLMYFYVQGRANVDNGIGEVEDHSAKVLIRMRHVG